MRYLVCAIAVLAAGCNSSGSRIVPPPIASTPIKHVVILLQENRSFNNLFMGFPGADTSATGKCKQVGRPSYCPKSGIVNMRSITLQEKGFIGGPDDLDHTHHAFEVECDPNSSNVCQMDGFNRIGLGEGGSNGAARDKPYSYVDRRQSKPYWDLASQYAIADHMFFTDTAASFIAHQEIIAGTVQIAPGLSLTNQPNSQPWGCDAPGPHHGKNQIVFTPVIHRDGRVDAHGPFPCFDEYKTIADLLDPAHVSWQYYVDRVFNSASGFSGAVWNGFDAIKAVRYGPDWHTHFSYPNSKILADAKNGSLPAVSWVIPSLCQSDHPASGANQGPKWITKVVNAIGTSKDWNSTAIVLLWDDWGGWYDNVPPAQIDYTSLGFRVPMIVISPYAKPHFVSHTQYDFGSVLKYVEETFNLGSLHVSDARANSMQDMFDYTQRPNAFKPAAIPHVSPCPKQGDLEDIIKADGGVPE